MKKGKRILTGIALVLFIGALGFAAYMILQVRTITVAGCDTRTQDEVIALSGLAYNTSIFNVDKQQMMDSLSTDPYIKPIGVDIEYPDHVVITIEERKEAARIEKDNAYIVIDHEGWVLRFETQPDASAYPMVAGLPADTVLIGQQIETKDTFKIGALTRVLDALHTAEVSPVLIDVSLAADIVLTLPDGLKLELGDDTSLDEKLALYKASLPEIASLGKTGGILDVSSVKSAYYR